VGLTARVLTGLVAGFLAGGAVVLVGNPLLLRSAELVQPLGQLWVNAIRMTVVPLVVSLLIVGIASAADLRAIGRVGGRSIALFLACLFGSSALAVLMAAPLVRRLDIDPGAMNAVPDGAPAASAAEAASPMSTIGDWLMELIPVNPVASAADGALLPLMIFTIAFAVALTQIPSDSRAAVLKFFDAVSRTMLVLVRWILLAAPVGVFALALPLAMNLGLAAVGALFYYVGLVAVLCLIVMLVLYPLGVVAGKVPLRRLANAAAPAQGVAFSSRSSLAALPLLIEKSASELRAPASISGFFMPFSVSVFRISAPIGIVAGVLFLAQIYGVELGTAQLVTIGLMAVLMSFSVPGIPGGSIIIMVPVLLATGIPVEGIGVLLAIDTVPDMFRTTANVTAHMALAAIVSRGMGTDEDGLSPAAEEAYGPTRAARPAAVTDVG
jgi:proton glutamate symport protein